MAKKINYFDFCFLFSFVEQLCLFMKALLIVL